MKNIVPSLCAALALAAGVAHAANDPLIGTWKADIKPGGDLKSETMVVTATPGGYTFNSDMQPAQGDAIHTSLPVMPDGKAHTANSAMGPITATCHRTDPHTIQCKVNIGGSDSKSVFVLSSDGKQLTEADTTQVVNVDASSSTEISGQNGKVTQGPTSSHTRTSSSEETETTVFHKQ